MKEKTQHQKNKEKKLIYQKKYYKKNKEEILAWQREYRKKNYYDKCPYCGKEKYRKSKKCIKCRGSNKYKGQIARLKSLK